ncbi:hypothetical protein MLD38_016150 [Melastoma candidum]|uniref:Uncharacterized protein n=1 Tax=Melastoma candidum TaxID=119954 RepID=A0ACB9RJ33_9MYRT|nr:hypothetical protein MLD38_016150 [Melastoma candidum]
MAIIRRANNVVGGERRNEGDQNYSVLEEDGLDYQLQYDDPPHFLAVMAAIEREDTEGLSRALDVLESMNIGINEAVHDDFPALHLACVYGKLSCVKLLLERGAGLEFEDAYGMCPLHAACVEGNPEVIQHLLNAAPSPHVIERMVNMVGSAELGNGETPLHFAASEGRAEAIRILMAAGADPRIRNKTGMIPADLFHGDSDAKRILEEFDSNIPRQ